MSFDDFYSDQIVRYANGCIPTDEFGLPDMGSASGFNMERPEGKSYGYTSNGDNHTSNGDNRTFNGDNRTFNGDNRTFNGDNRTFNGDSYNTNPTKFLSQGRRTEYSPYAAYAMNAGANSLVQGLNTRPDDEHLQNNSHLDKGYGNRFEKGGDGFNERKHRDQYGNSRSTGKRHPVEKIKKTATAPKVRRKSSRSDGFAVTGSRGTAPYPQAVDRRVNLYPESGDDYHLERQLTKDARLRKQGGNLVDKETTIFAPNPRSKDYVFNNKHGVLKVPSGFSMTSGTTITTDGDYGINPGSSGMPRGGVTSGFGSVGNQYTGNQGYSQVDSHPYIGYIPHEKTVIQGGNNTTIFYDRVDSRYGIQGIYTGPPENDYDDIGPSALVNAIGGDHPRNPITGELEKLGIPSMFAKPNGTINNFHRNIRFIKDNPQVTELYGANTFELMSDGLHSGHRQHGIVASAKKNIVGEQFNDRIGDLRFGNSTPYQHAITNSPGSTHRGIYLDMEVIKAVRPVTDYIFYLKTKGKIQPDMTDDFYFVTEEQYFSVQALDQHIIYNCLKRYNSGMIDVFKFLNYVFQFYFKHDKMTWSEFKIYSGYVDIYVKKHYGRALL